MKILIAGCGYLGTALGQVLLNTGAQVWGIRRDPEALRRIATLGIKPLAVDMLDPSTFCLLPSALDVLVFCQALSKDSDNYFDTYVKGSGNLIHFYRDKRPQKIVFISSTSVYSAHDGSWVNEATDPAAQGYASVEAQENANHLLRAEKDVLASGIGPIILRLAGIYGPGRNRIHPLREGKMVPSLSMEYTNRIHRDDAVSAIAMLIEKGVEGQVYIGADDYPATQKEFYTWLYEKMNLTKPEILPVSTRGRLHGSNKRCSNKKIKDLGFCLKYPTFREGYNDLF